MCRELFNRVGAVQREQFLVQAGGAFRPVRYGAPQFVGQAAWVEVGYAQRFRVDRPAAANVSWTAATAARLGSRTSCPARRSEVVSDTQQDRRRHHREVRRA